MAINTSTNKVRIISTTVSGLSANSKFSDIKSPALVVNTSDGGVFYADGSGGTSLKQLAALPNHTHSYLPLSGGTLTANTSRLLTLNNSNNTNNENGIGFSMSSVQKGWVGYDTTNGTYLYTYAGPHKLGIKEDGTGFIDGNTIIHSGNIGSQSVASANALGSYTIDNFMTFGNYTNYVGARFQNSGLAQLATDTYIEFWSSPGWYNSAWGKVTAHFGFTGNLTGNVTGNVSGSSGSCTGNATTATTAQQLSGFTKRASARATWGTLTSANGYTPVYWVDTAAGGGIGISDKSGQTFFQIDGYFYQNEGQYQVLDTNTGAAKSHTHTSVNDSASSAATTFAYSKTGLNYDDYSYLAAWNGYELRAVAKSQFAKASHAHSYLPLAGGAMTGNISFQGTKQSYTMIRFVDNTTDDNGNGISIGGGGATIIGGGESASAAQGLLSSGGDERMIICNDADIEFFSNCQSGIASRKTMTFNSAGQLLAGNFITNSDKRLKININEISSDKLSNSLNLNFVEFDYKDNDKHSAGHVAQEVKEVLPEFVHGNEYETEYLSIDYTGLHSVQIKALIDENNIMKKEIKELKELIKTLINEK